MTSRFTGRVRRVARVMALTALGAGGGTTLLQGGCLVTEYCSSDADCTAPQICSRAGACVFECERNEQCGEAMRCEKNRCRPLFVQPIECPSEMANVAEAFCIDRFEASRPDATSSSSGTDDSQAMSRAGVLPWQLFPPEDNETARIACLAAGKDLCTSQQWRSACEGRAGTAYGYGNDYEPETCNGIDTFGLENFHLLPTASLPRCQSDWGVYDINGNLWEHTLHGNDKTIRGGAYNCKDSKSLHRCDYVPAVWEPSARGFRCCLVPTGTPDAGASDADDPDAIGDVTSELEVGCVDDTGTPDVADAPAEAADVEQDVQDAPLDSFSQASTEGAGPCGAMFHVDPTGAFPACSSPYGVFDINGNVWELADSSDGLEHFRGGAYNCSDSEALHRCDHDGTWNPSAKGFRCCKDPS